MGHSDLSDRIVQAVADKSDAGADELEPLYTAINPDALDQLFKSDQRGMVVFRYMGYEVFVTSDGTIEIE